MNAPTLIIIVAIAILMVFALRRAYRVFSLKDDCCGGGPKAPKAKKVAAVTVEDTDEANYPFSLDVKVEDNSRKKKRRVIILILLLLLLLSIGSCAMWQFSQPKADPGATVQAHEGKSDEEVIAELNRQAEESRMTISVSAKPKLEDGKVRVNVSNVAENKFSQTFTLSQDGVELYSSGLIAPGEVVEWCEAPDAHEGSATVTVQGCDPETGAPSGNPQSVAVAIVAADLSGNQ